MKRTEKKNNLGKRRDGGKVGYAEEERIQHFAAP